VRLVSLLWWNPIRRYTVTKESNETANHQATPLFIDGTWHVKGTIPGEPGLYPALTFEYQPITWIELRKMGREQEAEKDPERQDEVRSRHVVSRIRSWDAGEVNADRLGRLAGELFYKLEAILFGYTQPDFIEIVHSNQTKVL